MAETSSGKQPTVAVVDTLIDENGSPVELPEATPIKVAGEHDLTVGATGPTNWWLYGLGALGIMILVLLVMQLMTGAPGTDVQPGSPTAEPVTEAPAVPAQ